MSLFKQFKMDQTKEVDGVDVCYGANADGSIPTFRVARKSASNPRMTKVLERETRQYRRQIELETLDEMVAQNINRVVFVDACLVGWSNVQDDKGASIPFNRDNALKLFAELPDLFADLNVQASRASLYRDERLESDAKN